MTGHSYSASGDPGIGYIPPEVAGHMTSKGAVIKPYKKIKISMIIFSLLNLLQTDDIARAFSWQCCRLAGSLE